MRKPILIFMMLQAFMGQSFAQTDPIIKSWQRNTTGATGYNGITCNVQLVQYSASWVYVSCTGIPSYTIGPWASNPNVATNQNFVFKFPRTPQANSGTLTTVGLGHIGVWTNGVSIFNPDDGMTYNNAGVWHRNAYYFEKVSFDACLGHPQQQGEYHHHINPTCIYNDTDASHHSPIIGWAMDGFPVYGAFAYTNTDGTGPIKRMQSSYQLRNITSRTTLPDGSTASSAGPAISTQYPLGCFIQDYVYTQGSGDLDAHNGRFCKTPDFPNGIYAYFVTIDAARTPIYPFVLGDTYYGVVPTGSTGPTSGHTTISESTTTYTGTASGILNQAPVASFKLAPNPVNTSLNLFIDATNQNDLTATIVNSIGQPIRSISLLQPAVSYSFDCRALPNGWYMLRLGSGNHSSEKAFIVQH